MRTVPLTVDCVHASEIGKTMTEGKVLDPSYDEKACKVHSGVQCSVALTPLSMDAAHKCPRCPSYDDAC